MKVRVFYRLRNDYFVSEVYALINTGWYEKVLVIAPSDNGEYIKFFDYIDKDEPKNHRTLIDKIILPYHKNWIHKRTKSVDNVIDDYANLLPIGTRFFEFIGFSWLYEDKALLTKLLSGDAVLLKGSAFENNLYSTKLNGWSYIESDDDIASFLQQTSGLHDSVIAEINYNSGAYVDNEKSMHMTRNRALTARIDSQWCKSLEIVFEGVTALNLRPPAENYGDEIYDVSLYIKNACIFFADSYLEQVDKAYDGTWVSSFSMRWRFI